MAEDSSQSDSGESGGKSSGFAGQMKTTLSKKVGGVPVWLIVVVGIGIVAYILKRRAAAAAAAAAASPDTSSAAGNVAGQTFPYGQPMNYSSDLYVNQPADPTTSPATTPTTPSIGQNPTQPNLPANQFMVLPGWHVDQWLKDVNALGYNVTYNDLVAANPSLVPNIDWNPTDRINFFKQSQTYTIPPQDMPKPGTMTIS